MTKDTPTTSTATETVRERIENILDHVKTGGDQLTDYDVEQVMKEFHSEQKALLERLRMEKESLPKNKCLNLETHKLGSCFSCEAIKGGNRKIDDFNAKIDAELEKL